MKKIFKSKRISNIIFGVLGLIIGGVIFGTLGIVATTNKLEAKYVMYTKDGETMTVQDAIKDLYALSKNNGGSNQTLAVGTSTIDGYKVTVPYIGSYPSVRCVYGTTENYGSVGTVSGNTCYFYGTTSNQKLYYKIIATDNNGKIYENNGSATTINTSLADNVKLGDYIYMKPTKTSYTLPTIAGVASATINPSELTMWRVIGINSKQGTVDVVSDKVSSSTVNFSGKNGYDNYESTLDLIAKQYINSDYVQNARYFSGELIIRDLYGNFLAQNPSGTITAYWLASSEHLTDEESYYYNTYRYYYINTSTSNNEYKYGQYWGDFAYCNKTNTKCVSHGKSLAIRPILTLKPTVKIISGTGTSSDNYQLGL